MTERTAPWVLFMPYHFAEAATDLVTHAALDPMARIPELKVCAVRCAGSTEADEPPTRGERGWI